MQRRLVMGNGWQLFSDVLDPHRSIPMSRKKEAIIGHVEHDRSSTISRLFNDEDSIWHARLGDNGPIVTVGKGGSVPLRPTTTIQFGEGRRILVVIE